MYSTNAQFTKDLEFMKRYQMETKDMKNSVEIN